MNYLVHAAYHDFTLPLRGRTVALVGPAGYVSHANIASFVDRADIVVRPNVRVDGRGLLVLPPNTTSRCDVVYHVCPRLGLNATDAWHAANFTDGSALGSSRVAVGHGAG